MLREYEGTNLRSPNKEDDQVYTGKRILKSVYTGRLVTDQGKAVPLQAWTGPEGSRNLRFPDFLTTPGWW